MTQEVSLLSKLAAVVGAVFERMLYRYRFRRCPLERMLMRGGHCDVRVRAQVVGHQLGGNLTVLVAPQKKWQMRPPGCPYHVMVGAWPCRAGPLQCILGRCH